MVLDQRAGVFAAAMEHHALRVGAGRGVGKAQAVLHVQTRAVVPDHARVSPEKSFLAVGEFVADAVDTHRRGQQAGDEVQQVHIMAADVGEGVGILGRHPVLEV